MGESALAPGGGAGGASGPGNPPLPWAPVPVRLREGLADEPVAPLPAALGRIEIEEGMRLGPSENARAVFDTFKPRPTDIFVATFAKTGTTLLQWICHQLRTGGHVDFEDLYQVSPWPLTAFDMGLDPNVDGSQYFPRVFKTHLRLCMIYPGSKYIVSLRRPANTIVSNYNFRINKGARDLAEMTVSEYALEGSFINGSGSPNHAGLYTCYNDYWLARDCPSVLVLVYEDLVKDMPAQIRLVSDFMGIEPTEALVERVAAMSTKEFMAQHESKLDESWAINRAKELGRRTLGSKAAPRVVLKAHAQKLSDEAVQFIEDQWRESVAPSTGFASYEDMAAFFSARNASRSAAVAERVSGGARRRSLCARLFDAAAP